MKKSFELSRPKHKHAKHMKTFGKKTNMIEKHVKEKKSNNRKTLYVMWLIYTYKFTYLCSNIEDLPKTNRQSNWELILTYRID